MHYTGRNVMCTHTQINMRRSKLPLFSEIYPMARKSDAGVALEIVIPKCLTIDGSKYQNASFTYFMKSFRQNYIQFTRTESE